MTANGQVGFWTGGREPDAADVEALAIAVETAAPPVV